MEYGFTLKDGFRILLCLKIGDEAEDGKPHSLTFRSISRESLNNGAAERDIQVRNALYFLMSTRFLFTLYSNVTLPFG